MGKSAPKAPAAPDPAVTAAAQTQSNKDTAYWNAVLNNVNQITPYGKLTYKQSGGGKKYNMDAYNAAMDAYNKSIAAGASTGTSTSGLEKHGDSWFDPKKGEYLTKEQQSNIGRSNTAVMPKLEDYFVSDSPPEFTSTVELSPEQQKLLDIQNRSGIDLASLGEEQIARIRNAVSTPYSYAGLGDAPTAEDIATASARGEEALMSRLNPQFARDEEALRTRLINQGIGQNSEAYNREFDRFNQAKNDARTQAVLQGANYGGTLQGQALQRRAQAINEYDTQRNAPLNEYIGLTSGQQVKNPTFVNQDYQGAQPVDYAGLVNNQYQQQLANYNAKVAGRNSTMNSLFGLGGAALSFGSGSGNLFGYKIF